MSFSVTFVCHSHPRAFFVDPITIQRRNEGGYIINNPILVVDDSTFMRGYIKKILIKKGFNWIVEAKTGEEAVVKYLLHRPQLVTMDITLPNINGIEATRRILRMDPRATIVICSSIGQKIVIEEALEAGARDFIIKPFREKEINTIIKNHLIPRK